MSFIQWCGLYFIIIMRHICLKLQLREVVRVREHYQVRCSNKHEHNHHNIMFSFCLKHSARITSDILSFFFSFMVKIRVEMFVNKIKQSIAWKCFRVTAINIQYKIPNEYLMFCSRKSNLKQKTLRGFFFSAPSFK